MNDITDESSDGTRGTFLDDDDDDVCTSDYYPDDELTNSSVTNSTNNNISHYTILCGDADDEMETSSIKVMEETNEEIEEMGTYSLCQKIDNIHNYESNNQNKEEDEEEILTMSKFKIGKLMGSGQFGKVYLAKTRKEKFICCLKIINMKNLRTHNDYKQLEKEVSIHKDLNHPYILQLYNWFQDKNKVVLVLECAMYGSMDKDLKNSDLGYYDAKTACKYTIQITDALNYCHSNNVIHRDLKTQNVLLDHCKNVKLCDFGCSTLTEGKNTTFCGTAEYLPPEMITDKKVVSYDEKIDIWALGILIFEMLTGETPFFERSIHNIISRIRAGRFHIPLDIDSEARDLIKKLLRRDPKKRIVLSDVLSHPWIDKYFLNGKLSISYNESL
uniref:Aurora kinase n=1 Tax=Strongyloides papillosus TaxID=174720 RepID=A0A0N5CGP0_STREA